MPKTIPGLILNFKGLWVRGHIDYCPPDHFIDSQNNSFVKNGVGTRDCIYEYKNIPNVVRSVLYKPNPPYGIFTIPRLIVLLSNGDLYDTFTNTVIASGGPAWKDIAAVNFFGRIYFSPNNGKTGLQNELVYVYDGTSFRVAAGPGTVTAPSGNLTSPGGSLEKGTHIFAVANESPSGFITSLSPRLVLNTVFDNSVVNFTNIPLGPTGTVARWIIGVKTIPLQEFPPFAFTYNGNDSGYPFYFIERIADNTTTVLAGVTYFDENLRDSADYLLNTRASIPAGVGMLDYKGRMIIWGIYQDPTLVLVSPPGDPETFSLTSGFIITDPTDNTGVRNCTEWQNNLYICKRQRVYVTEDNGDEASTWTPPINFEKALGTEHLGIAEILDAKGSSSQGFVIATLPGLYLFNGAFQEPDLSYKIKDLWSTINPNYFHLVKVIQDPENKRIYVLVPLGKNEVSINFILIGDYREGLTPLGIKWDKWKFPGELTDLAVYEDFTTADLPQLVTRIITLTKIYSLDVNVQGKDDGIPIDSFFITGPIRFGDGISHANSIRLRVTGPCTIGTTLLGQDLKISAAIRNISVTDFVPGREFTEWANIVSEQIFIKVTNLSGNYGINKIQLYGKQLWDERAR